MGAAEGWLAREHCWGDGMSDNAEKLKRIGDALEKLAEAVTALSGEERTFNEIWGWNCPALTRHDLALLIMARATKIRAIKPAELNSKFSEASLLKKIDQIKANTIPQLFAGNAAGAVPVILALLDFVDQQFRGLFEVKTDWEELEKTGSVPRKLAARVRSLASSLNAISAKAGNLEDQIAAINSAHAAAEALPTDMESLEEARQRITELEAESAKLKTLMEHQSNEIAEALERTKASEREAAQLVVNCGDAYSAATTKGLGEAFQKRADGLSKSMWVWVAGLMLALGIGAWLGIRRVEMIQSLIDKGSPSGSVGLYVGLALFSIAAPVWFAWIATKQIGQRFRLAEDYGFKASVAKAYEGYRREAAKLDESFTSRLFGTALDRIDEAPLRFVEAENHGSPLHELFSRRQGRDKPVPVSAGVAPETPVLIAEPIVPKVKPEEDED